MLPAVVQPFAAVTTERFAVAVLVLFVGVLAAAAHGAHRARDERPSAPFLLVAGALVANGLTHVAQAAWFRGYTPGVVTALMLVLPYGLLLGDKLEASRLATWRTCVGAVLAGMLIQVPVVVLALLAVR